MIESPKRKRGRPPSTHTGPSKQVQDQIRQCIAEHFSTGIAISKAAVGTHYFRYQNLYKEHAERIWDEEREAHYLDVAQQAFPHLREILINLTIRAGDFYNTPGKREISKCYRENPEEHADNMLRSIGYAYTLHCFELKALIEKRLKRRISADKKSELEYVISLVREELARIRLEQIMQKLQAWPSDPFFDDLLQDNSLNIDE